MSGDFFMSSSVAVPPSYPPTAVLTTADVSAWLRVHPRQLQRLGVPRLKLSHKVVRYSARAVQAWLDQQVKPKTRRRS